MGCGSSFVDKSYSRLSPNPDSDKNDPYTVEVNEIWVQALGTVSKTKTKMSDLVVKRKGWKTVRIFVSSTFKDFHQEREILVKKVFPDLRAWCESRKLYLVECDLRWGVPKDFNTEATLRACLGEIDRCYQDNKMPYFLNMTSERIGWIPKGEEVPEAVKSEYNWIEGLSVTEMEIMHGSYRIDNPNALFMLRDPSFINDVEEEHKKLFLEGTAIAPAKLQFLKKMIRDKFPSKRVIKYKVKVKGYNPDSKIVELGGLEDSFCKTVFEFFKQRISEQYPLMEGELDPYILRKEQHEAFMSSRCETVIGREDMIEEMKQYLHGVGNDVPFMLLGEAGSGKSSLMAKIADTAVMEAAAKKIPGGGNQMWHVFYHFVGAVPGSTELLPMLQRLLKELGAAKDKDIPSDMDTASQLTCSTLANPNTRPAIIVVDALNQFDEDSVAAEVVSWVPKKLAPHVRCIFSMIPETKQHKALSNPNLEPQPKILKVLPLTEQDRKAIVTELLGRYNKQLDESQMTTLLSKSSSENPLWLSIACEELRVFGMFRQVSDKVNKLPDGLLELEQMVLGRFEAENGGELLVATLCLLEVSARGLLETELLTILGDEDNLMPRKDDKDEGKEKEDHGKEKIPGQLPAYKWADIYRALRTFLRPFGDSGEGRLDFYHRSLSKAVRKKYFDGSDSELKYKWWHKKLAYFFDKRCKNINRKLEELPVHLTYIGEREKLEKFLTDWDVFEVLYNEEFSMKLLEFWRKGSDLESMETAYVTAMNNYINSPKATKQDICLKYEKLARFLVQGGRYNMASEYSNKAQEIESSELGARPHKMADLYFLRAQVSDEIMKLEEYMYRSQLPKMKGIIDNFTKASELFKTLPGDDMKRKLGRIYNRLSFYYSGYNLRGGDNHLSATNAQAKSVEMVDMAIEIFKQLNEELHVADSYITKGVSYGRSCPEQAKMYKEAEELTLRVGGELHYTLDRLYLNLAIYHEELGDYYKAYEAFRKWFDLCVNLYGIKHPKTRRPINTLREPMYCRIALEKEQDVPEMPSE